MFLDGKSHAHVCVLECVYILYSSHLIRSFSSAVLLKTLIIQYGRSLLKSHARFILEQKVLYSDNVIIINGRLTLRKTSISSTLQDDFFEN